MVRSPEEIKAIVKEKYAEAARQTKEKNSASCCGSTCGCSRNDLSIMADDYSRVDGYVPDADLGLGCGIPTDVANIKTGDTVLDLGSGAGNDVFVARRIVGETGRVIGVDMTEAMIEKANENNRKLGYKNVEFRYGEIENLPVASATVDVVVSNCVLNLVPDKRKAFTEMFRALKPGAHFSISDIVLSAELPPAIQRAAALYAGCVAGALRKDYYLHLLQGAGFINVTVKKEKRIDVPDDIFLDYISKEELTEYKRAGVLIESVTVYGERPKE